MANKIPRDNAVARDLAAPVPGKATGGWFISNFTRLGSWRWPTAFPDSRSRRTCDSCTATWNRTFPMGRAPQATHSGGRVVWFDDGNSGTCRCGVFWNELNVGFHRVAPQ